MAQRCDICGKGPRTGHSVSHSEVKTLRRFRPNLQTIRRAEGGRVRRLRVCTRCLRTLARRGEV